MKATFIYKDGSTEEFELDEDGISISTPPGGVYFYIGGLEYREGVEEIVIKTGKETSTELQAAPRS